MEDESAPDPKLLESIFESITKRYSTAHDYNDADVRMTTNEVYEQLQQLCPSEAFTPKDVYDILLVHYKLHEMGPLEFVWLLKKK